MARGVDELLEFLLEEIALRGNQGASLSDVQKLVAKFYQATDRSNTTRDEPHLLTVTNTSHGVRESNGPCPEVEGRFLDNIWRWLLTNDDIHAEEDGLVPEKARTPPAMAGNIQSGQGEYSDLGHEPASECNGTRGAGELPNVRCGTVLRVSTDRMWHALAGHGVDNSRVRATEFVLLSLIGAAGAQGIKQPDLTALSGQDKRSLPHRTDELHRKGYIEKKQVKVRGSTTSLCTLRRWVVAESTNITAEDLQTPDTLRNKIFGGGELRPDTFLEITLQILRNSGSLPYDEYRRRMGISGWRWENRVATKYLKSLETCGCIRRIRLPPEEQWEGKTVFKTIEYLQDPAPKVRAMFKTYAKLGMNLSQSGREHPELDGGDERDNGDEETALEQDSTRAIDLPPPPLWDPERLFLNFLFDIVDEGGVAGLSSMELTDRAVGLFYKRPLDQSLARITDAWQESQPSQLRHLAMIRDTGLRARFLHYQYRTHPNFMSAVRTGDLSWESVGIGSDNRTLSDLNVVDTAEPEAVDKWGFHRIPSAAFVGLEGNATVSECRKTLISNLSRTNFDNMPRPTLGRPRKYPKGEGRSGRDAKQTKRVAKEAKAFNSQIQKHAEFLARQGANLTTEPMLARTTQIGSLVGQQCRGRAVNNLEKKRGDEFIRIDGTSVPEDVVEHEESLPSDMDGKIVSTAETSVSQNTCNPVENANSADVDEGPSNAGKKRAATSDVTSLHNTKRMKTDAVELTVENELPPTGEIASTAAEIALALQQMLLPGIYINHPLRRRKTLGRPPKKRLYAVIKSDRLRSLEWFTASENSSPAPASFSEQVDCSPLGSPTLRHKSLAANRKHKSLATDDRPGHDEKLVSTDGRAPRVENQLLQNHDFELEASNMQVKAAIGDINAAIMTQSPGVSVFSKTSSSLRNGRRSTPQRSETSVGNKHKRIRIQVNDEDTHFTQNIPESEVLSKPSDKNHAVNEADAVKLRREPDEVLCFDDPIESDETSGPQRSLNNGMAAASSVVVEEDRESETRTADIPATVKVMPSDDTGLSARKKASYRKKEGVTLIGGSLALRKSQIILNILQEAGGIYPGDREMYYPFLTALHKTQPDARPDPNTVVRALTLLHTAGKIKRITFAFKDKIGVMCTRHILLLPHISVESAEVGELQRKMSTAHPQSFFPSGPEIDPSLRMLVTKPKTVKNEPKPKRQIWREPKLNENNPEAISSTSRGRTQQGRKPKAQYALAWQQWAHEENVQGANRLHLKDQENGASDFEDFAVDEQQARMQSTFRLETKRQRQKVGRSAKPSTISDKVVERLNQAQPTQWHNEKSGEDMLSKLLEQILNKSSDSRLRQELSFEEVVDLVQQWEAEDWTKFTIQNDSVNLTFINYTIPASDTRGVSWQPLRSGRSRRQRNNNVSLLRVRRLKHLMVQNRYGQQKVSAEETAGPSISSREETEPLQLSVVTRKRRTVLAPETISKPLPPNAMSAEQLQRYVTTIIIVRSLLGGNNGYIDWEVVHKLMPEFPRSFLQMRWHTIRLTKKMLISDLQQWFHESFVDAYEQGEISSVDYNNLENCDWEVLLGWFNDNYKSSFAPVTPVPPTLSMNLQAVSTPEAPSSDSADDEEPVELPSTRANFDKLYQVLEEQSEPVISRDDIFSNHQYVPVAKREQIVRDLPFSYALGSSSIARILPEDIILESVARSYVRANTLTPDSVYDAEVAKAKLVTLGEAALEMAVSSLLAAKVLRTESKGRPIPGRNYGISDLFYLAFKRVSYEVNSMFYGAVKFKNELDATFAAEKSFDLFYNADSSHVMVIMNLVAAGRISIQPLLPPITTDPSIPVKDPTTGERMLSVWGFTEGDYKTVYMDKENLIFTLRVTPTQHYVNGIPLADPLPAPPAPHLQHLDSAEPISAFRVRERRIPVWYDIHDHLLPQIWESLVSAIVTTAVLRPGSNEGDIVGILKGMVELWEVEYAVEWLLQLGVVRRMRGVSTGVSASIGGLTAEEWWWAVFGNGPEEEAQHEQDMEEGEPVADT